MTSTALLLLPLGWDTPDSASSYVKQGVGSSDLWGPFSTLVPLLILCKKEKGGGLKSFSCARGLSKLKPPKYSTKADEKTCSSKMQLKTFWLGGENKTLETTKTRSHNKLTGLFSWYKYHYAILRFWGAKQVYQSISKKQENNENWVLISFLRSLNQTVTM